MFSHGHLFNLFTHSIHYKEPLVKWLQIVRKSEDFDASLTWPDKRLLGKLPPVCVLDEMAELIL